jgi:hypothetical protein
MYKTGDKIKSDDINSMMQLLGDGFSARSFASASGDLVEKKSFVDTRDVIIQPKDTMPAYSAFSLNGEYTIGGDLVDEDSGRPILEVTKSILGRPGSTLFVTNGSVALQAGQRGWGKIMTEGDFYWVESESTAGCRGMCGFDGVSTKLQDGFPGFLGVGTRTIGSITCGYVTRHHSCLLGIAYTAAGPSTGGVFAKFQAKIYKTDGGVGTVPNLPNNTLSNAIIEVMNAAPSSIEAGARCLLIPYLGCYLAVEVC